MQRHISVVMISSMLLLGCNPKVNIGDTAAGGSESEEGEDPTSPETVSSTSTTTTGGSTTPEEEDDDATTEAPVLDEPRVDVLFVVDNTGSMGEEQRKLAEAMTGFVAALEQGDFDFRIAIKTTDNGNMWCPGTGPEAGRALVTSCRSRLGDFVFGSGVDALDMSSTCIEVCDQPTLEIVPTTTALDPTPTVRPWIEGSPDGTNLANGDVAGALRCALPTGINGCGFEQPLESMKKALDRTAIVGEPQHGFLRDDAHLAIIVVSDEIDCSARGDEIFSPDGNRVFWSSPESGAPTSAVCWNAGTSCIEGEGGRLDCEPADRDIDGNLTDDAEAVFHPLSRYDEALATVSAAKARHGARVFMFGILGVPIDFPETGEIIYTQVVDGTTDPNFLTNFGIGPGCSSATGDAVPPVRMLALASAWNDANPLFSICADAFDTALVTIVDHIADHVE